MTVENYVKNQVIHALRRHNKSITSLRSTWSTYRWHGKCSQQNKNEATHFRYANRMCLAL